MHDIEVSKKILSERKIKEIDIDYQPLKSKNEGNIFFFLI